MPRLCKPKNLRCSSRLESSLLGRGLRLVAGTDEAGRGWLLGPLYVAAVILDAERPIPGLDDSKKLSAQARSGFAGQIREKALAYQVIAVPAREVDDLNVYEATRQAMIRALLALDPLPEFALADAMRLQNGRRPGFSIPYWALIHGDARSVSIAAASILAKVARDDHLDQLGPPIPAIWPGAKQRLRDAGPPGRPGPLRPLPRTPADLPARQGPADPSLPFASA